MLPIVKRKALEIPHGLAAVAAAVCLILAFATDLTDRDGQEMLQTMAEHEQIDSLDRSDSHAKSNSNEFSVGHAVSTANDQSAAADSSRKPAGKTSSGNATSNLITWFGLRR